MYNMLPGIQRTPDLIAHRTEGRITQYNMSYTLPRHQDTTSDTANKPWWYRTITPVIPRIMTQATLSGRR